MRNFLLLLLFLTGCSSVPIPSFLTPYKIDIQQGNFVDQEMVAKLKPGMTKSQARFVLGTPLVTDVFHQNRWDYVYRYQKAGVLTEYRKIALIFEGDTLLRMEGDIVPATGGVAGTTDAKPEIPKAQP